MARAFTHTIGLHPRRECVTRAPGSFLRCSAERLCVRSRASTRCVSILFAPRTESCRVSLVDGLTPSPATHGDAMASIYDTHGSSLRLSSTDLDNRPLYLASRAATVIARVSDHIARDHECRAIDADLSARAHVTAYRLDATDTDSARDGLEAALDCAEAIRAERACLQRIIDTARIALAALDDAERDADRMANDARAALVAAGAAQ